MPKKQKKYNSERALLAAIHECHREAQACIVEAESLETIAKQYFTMPDMVEDARLKKSEAQKLRKRANRLLDVKSKRLGEALSEFQTNAMPFLSDVSVRV